MSKYIFKQKLIGYFMKNIFLNLKCQKIGLWQLKVTGTAGTIVDSLKVYRKNSGGTSSYGNPSGGKGFDTSSATSSMYF